MQHLIQLLPQLKNVWWFQINQKKTISIIYLFLSLCVSSTLPACLPVQGLSSSTQGRMESSFDSVIPVSQTKSWIFFRFEHLLVNVWQYTNSRGATNGLVIGNSCILEDTDAKQLLHIKRISMVV